MVSKVNQENYPLNIRFNLRRTTPNNIETPINAVVRFNNQRLILSKISKIEPRYWKDGKPRQMVANINHAEISKSMSEATTIIKGVFSEYVNTYNRFPDNIKAFQELLRKRVFNIPDEIEVVKYDNLEEFLTRFITRCELGLRNNKGEPLSENTIKVYRTMLRNIKMFKDTGHDISLNKLGLEFYENYKEFLTHTLQYGANTISKHQRALKAVVNEAREEGLTDAVFSGRRYSVSNVEVTKVYLNKVELQDLFKLDLSKQPTTLGVARDLFLLGANSALRFGDWLKLDPKKMQDDIIVIKTEKTGVTVAVPINKMIKDIFKKYEGTSTGLPPKMTNQEVNRYIKTACEKANINEIVPVEKVKAGKKVSVNTPKFKLVGTHTARRSAATNMYNDGIPTISIMRITGHTTETNFMKYIVLKDTEHAKKILEITKRNEMKLLKGGVS